MGHCGRPTSDLAAGARLRPKILLEIFANPLEPGGAAQELAVVLQPGTYELWCPVGDHRALGMTVTITVA